MFTRPQTEGQQRSFWGVTTYFNPAGYANKLSNLRSCTRAARRQGLRLLIVELAFGNAPHVIADRTADRVIRLRTRTVLWHKERLLNIGVKHLPEDCQHVAWIDADILFTNEDWVETTRYLLSLYPVVQPYDTAIWLSADQHADGATPIPVPPEGNRRAHSAAFAVRNASDGIRIIARPHEAAPGLAWAARREILLSHGLYDRLIVVGGDFIATSAMYGTGSGAAACSLRPLISPKLYTHLSAWSQAFHQSVNGHVGCTPGAVLHLWHGQLRDRRYLERYSILKDSNFDPEADIRTEEDECWSWATEKQSLHHDVEAYFRDRQEDLQRIDYTALNAGREDNDC